MYQRKQVCILSRLKILENILNFKILFLSQTSDSASLQFFTQQWTIPGIILAFLRTPSKRRLLFTYLKVRRRSVIRVVMWTCLATRQFEFHVATCFLNFLNSCLPAWSNIHSDHSWVNSKEIKQIKFILALCAALVVRKFRQLHTCLRVYIMGEYITCHDFFEAYFLRVFMLNSGCERARPLRITLPSYFNFLSNHEWTKKQF